MLKVLNMMKAYDSIINTIQKKGISDDTNPSEYVDGCCLILSVCTKRAYVVLIAMLSLHVALS